MFIISLISLQIENSLVLQFLHIAALLDIGIDLLLQSAMRHLPFASAALTQASKFTSRSSAAMYKTLTRVPRLRKSSAFFRAFFSNQRAKIIRKSDRRMTAEVLQK